MERDIRNLVLGLRKSINEIDTQLKYIEKSDTFKENTELTDKNAKLAARNEKLAAELAQLSADNAALKNALYEQYFNEKVSTVEKTRRNLDIFFAKEADYELNHLAALEASIKQRLTHLAQQLVKERIEDVQEINQKMAEIQNDVTTKIIKAKMAAAQISVSEREKAEFERLKQENLTGEQITQLSRKNNFERYVGLNILNTIGIVLFIIGAFTAGQLGHIWISFALGAGFLVVGEIMNRKRANVFSLGVTAGGVGILYASLALGHFVHDIISMYPALGICVAITALTFYLSTRYKAQTLLGITLVGGYLPLLSILLDGADPALLFGMMAYFVLFNLLALMLAFRNKWTWATFVGLGLNIIGTALISFEFHHIHNLPYFAIETVFIGFAMLVYNAIPIIGTYMTKAKFRQSDLALISINTFFGSIIMFVNISDSGWNEFLGLAAAIYALMYLGTSYLVSKKFEDAKAMTVLFFIVGIAFTFLAVPWQFEYHWLTPAWMLLATGLTVFGIFKEKRMFRAAGFTVGGIALFWFITYDITQYFYLFGERWWFTMQYASITAASLIVIASYILKNQIFRVYYKVFKYFAAVNLWLFAIFMVYRLWDALLAAFPQSVISIDYLMVALGAVVTMAFGKIYPNLPRLADGGMKIIGTVFSFLGLFVIFFLGISANPLGGAEIAVHPTDIAILATVILIAVEAMGIFAIYDITRRAVVEKIMGIQFLPLIVSAYIVIVFTVTLTLDYGLAFASFWISAIYVITALLWTVLGFVRRYSLLRRFGLALALFSVIKLFIFDLAILTQEFQILSYFIMGAVLVAISFVYQYFSKRLELGVKVNKGDDAVGVSPHHTEEK
ncbi:MAG: DUF2339 domain-containing protein [Defluviitaleaceae bacterium]|nr:DUF2339 domain-containing protein [Defluviitaleaceae bacterium]